MAPLLKESRLNGSASWEETAARTLLSSQVDTGPSSRASWSTAGAGIGSNLTYFA